MKTALHIAAKENFTEMVKLLLESNADPNCQDKVSKLIFI